MSRRALALVVAAVALASCRDGVGIYELDTEPLTGQERQLTSNDHAEYAPSWSAGSDSVYYSTGDFVSYRGFARTLLRISVEGGTAHLLAPGAQSGGAVAPQPPLAAPVLSPDASRLAYVQLFCHDEERQQGDSPYNCVNGRAVLDSAMLRVRPADGTGPVSADAAVTVRSGGLDGLAVRPS
ncbi:MAG TPA: hypothetical protein VK928_13905, partial [Longimicrobiales bacterium]|nr:hypothetical protein [Longimicrobiales bacterium]